MKVANPGNAELVEFISKLESQASNRGNKFAFSLRKARASIAKCTTLITSGEQALKLDGIGAATARKIESFLSERGISNETANDKDPLDQLDPQESQEPQEPEESQNIYTGAFMQEELELLKELTTPAPAVPQKRKRANAAPKQYIPRKGSYPYAVLLHFADVGFSKGSETFDFVLSKQDIMKGARKYMVDVVEDNSAQSTNFVSWNSTKTLITRNIMVKQGRSTYKLTKEGANLAKVLRYLFHSEVTPPSVRVTPQFQNIDMHAKKKRRVSAAQVPDKATLSTPTRRRNIEKRLFHEIGETARHIEIDDRVRYRVVLVVDSREKVSITGATGTSSGNFLKLLEDAGVPVIRRMLSVGDMMWIGVPEGADASDEEEEIILEYIVERKKLSDIVASIIDGRCNEQKYRLSYESCSLNKVIYLIEGDLDMNTVAIAKDRVRAMLVSLALGSNFHILNTKSLLETVDFLKSMTEYQQRLIDTGSLEEGTLFFSFKDFKELTSKSSKNMNVTCIFGMQLTQIPLVTGETAQIVVDNYPTPLSLLSKYMQADREKGEKMLIGLTSQNVVGKSVSAVSSKNIYQSICIDNKE